MSLDPKLLERIEKLKEKYDSTGQDLSSYLDGLLYADYLTYWDYIHLDTLLSLQTPKTSLPDEKIFILYHQITELYFKLIINELEQIVFSEPNAAFFLNRLGRINRYVGNLVQSFDVMVDGMDKEQFLKYRMSLLPASGFQSAQYRMIELMSTDFINLVHESIREEVRPEYVSACTHMTSLEEASKLFDKIYWKKGATELATGKKTFTLVQFEQKYDKQFISLVKRSCKKNLLNQYHTILFESDAQKEAIINEMRLFDQLVNVNWCLAHYKSAVRYLQRNPEDIKATGGTNWQQYLPPRFQRIIYFPELWSETEKAEWGKTWVEELTSK